MSGGSNGGRRKLTRQFFVDRGRRIVSLNLMRYPETIPPAPPEWMKVRLKMGTPDSTSARAVREVLTRQRLVTVCEEASCPNLGHCWSQGTATFMIMGDKCTRSCGFCDIRTAKPMPLDAAEPQRIAQAIQEMKLRHAVITSVDRDDLADCGSTHFAAVIAATRALNPETTLEVLIPDFKGKRENLERIWNEKPDIINHNVETVPTLYKSICPQSNYQVSLDVLRMSAQQGFLAKSGIILGLGEEISEVKQVISDLKAAGTQLLTIGQYLQPSSAHAPLKEFVAPEVFDSLKEHALAAGFIHVEAGPLVRSSYHAGDALDRIFGRK